MIHPLAYIDKSAELGRDVYVGPHCFVGPNVVLGDECELRNNVTVTGGAVCGKNNVFFAGAVIGEDPQDLKYKQQQTRLIIGDDNVFRECVTANRGTEVAGGVTRIGSHNRFMAYVHIAHDVIVGNNCILSNAVQLAGHVELEDKVTMGGLSGVHHFSTVGTLSYVAGMARIPNDVPPFMIWGGDPGEIRGCNSTGLKRWGMDEHRIRSLREAYRILFGKKADEYGASVQERMKRLEESGPLTEDVDYLFRFLRESMDHGVYGRKRERLRCDTDADRANYYKNGADTESCS